MMDLVANRLDLRPAAELLGGWPGSNLFAYKRKCGSRTERVKVAVWCCYLSSHSE